MTKTKKYKRPKSKKTARLAKKKIARSIKTILKKSQSIKIISDLDDDLDFLSVIRGPSGLRTYERVNFKYNGTEPEFLRLQDFNWLGLMTLKFHSQSYCKDDYRREGEKNRFGFLAEFMDNLTSKFRIKKGEFNWYACEEFGFSGDGHLHVIFSFDHLKTKGREDKIPKFDFSENDQFYRECVESVGWVSQKIGVSARSIDFHWRPQWENTDLVGYFCKKEFRSEPKRFKFSKYWEIHENLLAA